MELTNAETKITSFFSKKMDLTHIDKIKLIYGLRLVIADFKKMIFLYGIAFLIGCFIETLLIHASFYIFRQVAFGAHSKNFYICLVVSSITFPTSAFLLKNLEISTTKIWITYCIAAIPLFLFAPIGTNINAIRGRAHALYLKKKLYIRLFVLGIILIYIPVNTTKFLVMGLFIESITIVISVIKKEIDINVKNYW